MDGNYTLVDEVCCSGVVEDVGHGRNGKLARQNIETILATGAKTIITGCPYWYRTFKHKMEEAGNV